MKNYPHFVPANSRKTAALNSTAKNKNVGTPLSKILTEKPSFRSIAPYHNSRRDHIKERGLTRSIEEIHVFGS